MYGHDGQKKKKQKKKRRKCVGLMEHKFGSSLESIYCHYSLIGFPKYLRYLKKFMIIQIQSFETELSVPELASKEGGPDTFRGVFIRAPAILEVGPEVQVLADYPVPSNNILDSNSTVEAPEVCHLLIGIMIF